MSEPIHPSPLPWPVVESVLLAIARVAPTSLHVTRDPAARIGRHAGEGDHPRLQVEADGVACAVWIGDGVTACVDARAALVELAARCRHDLFMVEPIVPGCGIGLHMLRAIDPQLVELTTDEIGDGPERTRERKPWEPPAKWVVGHVRPWRFEADAELAREGFMARLSRMSAPQMLLAARRVLARFPRAHELLLLGVVELVARGDEAGARALWGEIEGSDDPGSVRRLARAALLDGFAAAWLEPPRATG